MRSLGSTELQPSRREAWVDPAVVDAQAELATTHWWFVARQRIFRRIGDSLIGSDRGASVVDLGCGVGANLAAFSDSYQCVGFDVSPRAVAHARTLFPTLRFHDLDEGVIPEAVEGADLVLMTDVLEHVVEDKDLLTAVVDSVKPGGRVLITVPAHPELWSSHDVALGHHRRYDIDAFAALRAGLPVQTQLESFFNARLFRLANKVRGWRSRKGRDHGSDMRPVSPPLNAVLRRVFEGEARRLVAMLEGGAAPYRSGLSLMAVLRREYS